MYEDVELEFNFNFGSTTAARVGLINDDNLSWEGQSPFVNSQNLNTAMDDINGKVIRGIEKGFNYFDIRIELVLNWDNPRHLALMDHTFAVTETSYRDGRKLFYVDEYENTTQFAFNEASEGSEQYFIVTVYAQSHQQDWEVVQEFRRKLRKVRSAADLLKPARGRR